MAWHSETPKPLPPPPPIGHEHFCSKNVLIVHFPGLPPPHGHEHFCSKNVLIVHFPGHPPPVHRRKDRNCENITPTVCAKGMREVKTLAYYIMEISLDNLCDFVVSIIAHIREGNRSCDL